MGSTQFTDGFDTIQFTDGFDTIQFTDGFDTSQIFKTTLLLSLILRII